MVRKERQREDAQAKQQQALVKVKGELNTLVVQEQQRRAAESARQAEVAKQQAQAALLAAQQRATAAASAPSGRPSCSPTPPATVPPRRAGLRATTPWLGAPIMRVVPDRM